MASLPPISGTTNLTPSAIMPEGAQDFLTALSRTPASGAHLSIKEELQAAAQNPEAVAAANRVLDLTVKKGEQREQYIQKMGPLLLKELNITEAEFGLLHIKDALILRVIQLMQELLNDKTYDFGADTKCLFIVLIEQLVNNDLGEHNKATFTDFAAKLTAQFPNAKLPLPVKRVVNTLSMLASIEMSKKDPRTVLDFVSERQVKPGNKASSNEATIRGLEQFTNVLFEVVEGSFKVFNSQEDAGLKSIVRKKAPFLIEFLEKFKMLQKNYVVRKKIILSQIKSVKEILGKQTSRSAASIEYSIHQLQVSAKLLKSNINQMASELSDLLDNINDAISEEDVKLIHNEVDKFHLRDEQSDSTAKAILNSMVSVPANAIAVAGHGLEAKELVKDIKAKLPNNKFLSQEQVDDATKALDQTAQAMDKVNNMMTELADKLLQLGNSLGKLGSSLEKRAQVKQETRKQIEKQRLKKTLAAKKEAEDKEIKSVYRFLYGIYANQITPCLHGFAVLCSLLETFKESWLKGMRAPESPAIDFDKMWPLYHDSQAKTIEAADVEEEEKEEAEIVPQASQRPNPVAVATQEVRPARYSQILEFSRRFEGFSIQMDASLSGKERTHRSNIAHNLLQDASLHLRMMFGTINRLKECLQSGDTRFYANLAFSIARNASIITETHLKAEKVFRFGDSDVEHSQTHLNDILPPSRALSEADRKEQSAICAKYDLMVYGHRCPYYHQSMLAHQGLTTPVSLKWLLDPTKVTAQALIDSAVEVLRFVEIRTAGHWGVNHNLSDMVKDELDKALTAAPVTLEIVDEDSSVTFRSLHGFLAKGLRKAESRTDDKRGDIIAAYKNAQYHLKWLEKAVLFWHVMPGTVNLSSHGDDIWTHLQFLDEQIETFLNIELNDLPQWIHSLSQYRGLRNFQEVVYAQELADLDVEIGAHYLHWGLQYAKDKVKPLGLQWRLDSDEASLVGEALDANLSAMGTNGSAITASDKDKLNAQLKHMVDAVLIMQMAKRGIKKKS